MKFVVVGTGKTAIMISKAIASQTGATLTGMVGDSSKETPQSSFVDCAVKLGVASLDTNSINTSSAIKFLQSCNPDYVISANNFMIFGSKARNIAKIATVNFHNGPLPSYGGVNPFCWALIRGEKFYGITWHIVDAGIDTGPILLQERFKIEENDRALTVMIKCIEAGISSFQKKLLPILISGALTTIESGKKKPEYFPRKLLPFSGLLPWWLNSTELVNYSKAMDFFPFPNLFYRPMIKTTSGKQIFVGKVELRQCKSSAEPGTVTSDDEVGLTIASHDYFIYVSEFFKVPDLLHETKENKHSIKVNDVLISE